jgi:hypothetical protein
MHVRRDVFDTSLFGTPDQVGLVRGLTEIRARRPVLERNRQRSMARGQFAEQIAVQIIHMRANEDSDPHPVAPNPAVSNHRNDLRRIRIKNDVLGKDES